MSDTAPVEAYVEGLIEKAARRGASDIHIEPFEDHLRIRIRVDGSLHTVEEPSRALHGPLIGRLKILGGLDAAEKRKAQDGRLRATVDGRPLDLRLATIPALHGETAVLRLLDPATLRRGLADLGLDEEEAAALRAVTALAEGLVLVSGPTGSGKTTTLYALLQELNRPDVKILTVEDPVEYELDGINQTGVRPQVGLTFASVLRALLRQAPNIILVGEIRDAETARIAVHAALTGHLVLATVHTNDAPAALARLLDLGAEPFLLAEALRAVFAQRLLRTLCPRCKAAFTPDRALAASFGLEDAPTLHRPTGCAHCAHTGYRGRRAVFEALTVGSELRDLLHEGAPLSALRAAALRTGMRPLREAALARALAGETSPEEVLLHTAAEV